MTNVFHENVQIMHMRVCVCESVSLNESQYIEMYFVKFLLPPFFNDNENCYEVNSTDLPF